MTLAERLVQCWYAAGRPRGGRWCYALLPLAWLFRFAAGLRRAAYAHGWRSAIRLPVPVLVVGNITAGGTGKTPLVIWLARRLRAAGLRPGIISRGYRGRAAEPRPVSPAASARDVGDEPLLLARRAGCPVWIGRRRSVVGACLLQANPEVDVLLSDDGLQHYRLARDVEIVVLDGVRGLGNGRFIPAGPLREGPGRLGQVDAIVWNGEVAWRPCGGNVPQFSMRLSGGRFYNLRDPGRQVSADHFLGCQVHALAGIGHPERFFALLASLGVEADTHAYPDHHDFVPQDLPSGCVILTEKDAVKCSRFAHADVWVLPVDAEVEPGLETLVLDRLKAHYGQQTPRNPGLPAV